LTTDLSYLGVINTGYKYNYLVKYVFQKS